MRVPLNTVCASRTFPLQNDHRAHDITEDFLEESRSRRMEKNHTVVCKLARTGMLLE